MNADRHHDADLVTFFAELEAAQAAARMPQRTRQLRQMLEGVAAGPLLARPTLAQQRLRPN